MLRKIGDLGVLLTIVLGMVACGTSGDDGAGTDEGSATITAARTSTAGTVVKLSDDYADALPVSSQLALGTLMLEGMEDAVTVEQASELLPNWRMLEVLQSGGTAAEAELNAVLSQIQRAMTDEQLIAIKEMQLTPDSMMAQMQEQGLRMGAAAGTRGFRPPARVDVGGAGGPGDQFGAFGGGRDLSPEEQEAAMAERMNSLAGTAVTGMVVSLLGARAEGRNWEIDAPNQETELPNTPRLTNPPPAPTEPATTATSADETVTIETAGNLTPEVSAEGTSEAGKTAGTPEPSDSETATAHEMPWDLSTLEWIGMTETETTAATHSETVDGTAAETTEASLTTTTGTPAPPPAETAPVNQAPAASSVNLARIPDPDPAPPLTILVSTIQIKENGYYKLTGTIRNDGSEIYGGIGVIATFYEQANECTTRVETKLGRDGSERTITVDDCDYNWHGPVEVYAAYQLLEPGAQCPFSLEIYGRDYVSYLLHPEGTPVQFRQPASLALSGVNVTNTGFGTVRITGTATNQNPVAVRDANVAATLIDASGQITSVGSVIVPGEIASGTSVGFDLLVEYEPYVHYQIDAQATQD